MACDDRRGREHILSLVDDFIHTDTVVSTLHASKCHTHTGGRYLS